MSGWGIPDNNFTLKRKNLVLEAVAVNLSAGTGRIISIHFKLNCSDFVPVLLDNLMGEKNRLLSHVVTVLVIRTLGCKC